jgi:hypothetical protein
MCGQNEKEAFVYLVELERLTAPVPVDSERIQEQADTLLYGQSR